MSASSFSLGSTPASEFLVAFTITMTRMFVLPVRGCRFRSLSGRRTTPARIDKPANFFWGAGPGLLTDGLQVDFRPRRPAESIPPPPGPLQGEVAASARRVRVGAVGDEALASPDGLLD